MTDHTSDQRTHGLLEDICAVLSRLRGDDRLVEHVREVEGLLRVLIGIGESQNQKLDRLIELSMPPDTFPQATSATVTVD